VHHHWENPLVQEALRHLAVVAAIDENILLPAVAVQVNVHHDGSVPRQPLHHHFAAVDGRV